MEGGGVSDRKKKPLGASGVGEGKQYFDGPIKKDGPTRERDECEKWATTN